MSEKKTTVEDTDVSLSVGEVEETILLATPPPSDSSKPSKQERDLAIAVTALRGHRVSQRQLARAVTDWTTYGNQSLVERLVQEQLINATEAAAIEKEADQLIARADRVVARPEQSHAQLVSARLAHLDSSGRLCKLLGLNNAAATAAEESDRELFARFTLIRKLGEGGLGVVWLARDENLRRYVAIKEIRAQPGTETDAALARFRREAEVTGRLEHPGIVPIYQFGTDQGSGRYFYVMRFLGKQTMHDAIVEYHERRDSGDDEPLLLHRLLTAYVKLCHSVAHAHSRKVVHRDLKPENVALDSFGQVVLLDWGLAKINDETGASDYQIDREESPDSEASLTIASQVLGSPLFMAPEQAAGRIDEIDERTDVYGLGGILYSILTGQAPHERSCNAPSATMSDVLSTIVSRSALRPRDIVPNAAPELDAICVKATHKKRYLRYASASDIAEDVERYMAGDRTSAYAEPTSRKIKRWINLHPRLSQLAALAAMLLMLGILTIGYSIRQTQVAETTFRFQQTTDVAQELSFHLQSQADNVIRDSRFVTGLPPVQAIIATRKPDATPLEDESVWRNRLADIFEGLMWRNESYLGIAFMSIKNDQVEPLVRLERNLAAGTVRRMPDSLLQVFPVDEEGPPIYDMMPGDVILLTSDDVNKDAPTQFRDALSLAALNAVFDETTGEMFGLMAIQLDLRQLVRQRIESTRRESCDVFVTDGAGGLQLEYVGGRFIQREQGASIITAFPQLSPLFAAETGNQVHSDQHTLYATRLRLGDDSSKSFADLGIVVKTNH